MLPSHIPWSSIELLHNVVRTLNFLQERNENPHLFQDSTEPTAEQNTQPVKLPRYPIAYKAKVKQHGSNCAVQVTREGVFAQSRTQMLVNHVDYKGFAQWVAKSEPYWKSFQPGATIFGEWCGPGVEAGMAISKYERKVFAIFAMQLGRENDARVIYDPKEIAARLPQEDHPDVFVLPWWEEANVSLHFGDAASLEKSAAHLNQLVEAVEREDPWVKTTFGISGLGEGLVFYPIGEDIPTDPEGIARLMFKAKGEKHRTVNTKACKSPPKR